MALWDIRAKAAGWPLYRMLGGAARPIRAYAGGISLGFQPPGDLVEEAQEFVTRGYRVLKLRIGDSVERDVARIQAVRRALGPDIDILADANAAYNYEDVRRVMPVLDACSIGWLEEPFAPHDHRSYAEARRDGRAIGWNRIGHDLGLPQDWGSGSYRRLWIDGWPEFLSEAGAERAIVDGATNLQQEIGATSRPAHLLRFIHSAVHQEIGCPFGDRGSNSQSGTLAFGVIDQPCALATEITVQRLQGGPQLS